jgi:DNA-directed RNA polymerase subunit RPC12/RpoP
MAGESGMGRRILGIAFIVAAFGAAIVIYFKWAKPAWTVEGSVDTDQMWLLCAKCDGESSIPFAKFVHLPRDEAGSTYQCPKCGAMAAVIASARCGKCGRLLVGQSSGAAYVCPHCKAPLGAPPPEAPGTPKTDDKPKARTGGSDKP